MCRSFELEGSSFIEVGGRMPGGTHQGARDSKSRVFSVALDDCSHSRDGCETGILPKSPNTAPKRIRCPLKILLTALLGICCTFVTYLCLPEDCSREAYRHDGHAGRLIHRSRHLHKRNAGPLLESPMEDTAVNGRLLQYCNFGHSGEEGQGISENYDLVQVHLLLSPGQRSLISTSSGLPVPRHSCRLDNKAKHFPEVWNFMQESISYKKTQHNRGGFKLYDLYPWGATCQPGQLLPDGIHQLVLLGKFLKNAYREKFQEMGRNSVDVHALSAPDEVHYQTAMAFSQGFLETNDFKKLIVQKALENFCLREGNQSCRCQYTEVLKEPVDRAVKQGHFMFKPGHSSTNQLAEKISCDQHCGSVVEISQNLLLRACQGMKFFCNAGADCLTPSLIATLIEENDSYWQNLSRDTVFRSYAKLHSYPFLKRIVNFVEEASRTGSHTNSMYLYSSEHDFSTQVLSALGFKVSRAPSYANRLAFEIWVQKSRLGERKHLIRVLHDGIDVTPSLPFCRNRLVDGLCKVKFLIDYLKGEILSHQTSYGEACKS
ncbi:2-phosphoxylose phosphatase 1-like [Liolophura sinensis]|uniref:2-phosphoxylose phosphatase 1-like n=1 Tax=Liolophura sinensis TaxID=3198878 RepID=UPI0031594A29